MSDIQTLVTLVCQAFRAQGAGAAAILEACTKGMALSVRGVDAVVADRVDFVVPGALLLRCFSSLVLLRWTLVSATATTATPPSG